MLKKNPVLFSLFFLFFVMLGSQAQAFQDVAGSQAQAFQDVAGSQAQAFQDVEDRPDEMLRGVTIKVLERLEKEESRMREGDGEVYQVALELVDELILPILDFDVMSIWMLGKHWKAISEQQKDDFQDAFKQMLIHTYATALLGFQGKQVEFSPHILQRGKTSTVVHASFYDLQDRDGPGMPIAFRLRKEKLSGKWKVFDVVVEGISLVKSYQSSFRTEIDHNGIDGLIRRLHEHNHSKS